MDTTQDSVDLTTAAARLGISLEAVRKRVQRRQLAAHKVDGRWYVVLDRTPYTSNGARPGQDPVQDRVQDPSWTRPSDGPMRELADTLRAEVEHLRRELAIRNEELQRKDAIIMALAQRPALPPPATDQSSLRREDSADQEARNHVPDAPRPWWQRWWPWTG